MIENMHDDARLSKCIDKSLAQLKNKEEIFYYPISQENLITWHACPLCHNEDIITISEVYLQQTLLFFSTALCQKCLHLFRNISPNAAWFNERWKQISTGQLCVYNAALEEKRKIRYELYYGLLHKYKNKGLLLDIGAAYGSGTMVFSDRGFATEALEPEKDRAEYIRQICQLPVHSCTLEDFDPKDKQYDIILFSHCLEHLDDPLHALTQMKNWLSPDGILYIEIPIAWKVIDWQDALFMAHKHNFVEKNIHEIVERVGYKIIDSYLIPDNDAPFCNLALITVKNSHSIYGHLDWPGKETKLMDPLTYHKEDLMNLYRIQLPIQVGADKVLKYNVPYINHFYHILRKDRHQCHYENGYISYC